MRKSIKRLLSAVIGAAMAVSMIPTVFAATEAEAVIDYNKTASLTMYKFDFTAAEKDGVWTEDSFVSTGVEESYVTDKLLSATRNGASNGKSELENGGTSNGYAIKGVVFSYLRIADVLTYSEVVGGVAKIHDLYGFEKSLANGLLEAIGLRVGGSYVDNFVAQGTSSTPLDNDKVYFTADTLNKYLYDALTKDATTVKNALETYVKDNGGIAMPETDQDGKTAVDGLAVGLYLLVEISVPEMVTSTTDPFFVSLPMTTFTGGADGNGANSASPAGGHEWNYNVVLYPKNQTGIPSLEKTVREGKDDTGKNDGTDSITDGYAHTATASTGDTLEWQIISTLPTITSQATALTHLSWVDQLDAGMKYGEDATIRIYSDKDCTNLVATWGKGSANFTQEYFKITLDNSNKMVVTITDAGLNVINGYATKNVNSTENTLYSSYSNYTVRITYTTTLNADKSFIYGDEGNDNLVIFTWKRTNSEYFDTLVDDAHVYSYGIDVLKLFSDLEHGTQDMYDHVKFLVYNATDGYWVKAELNAEEGVYYVTGHSNTEAGATQFVPVTYAKDGEIGRIVIKGLEDDEYMLTEIETANGYVLLTDHRYVEITSVEDPTAACDIYTREIENYLKGLVQNDPRYSEDSIVAAGWAADNILTNIPQEYLEHFLRTASATVDGVAIDMRSSESAEAGQVSANALAYLEIINHVKPDIPNTGDDTLFLISIFGAAALVSGICLILLPIMKRRKEKETESI